MTSDARSTGGVGVGPVLLLVLLVTLSRILTPTVLGYPSNFSPVNALALFGGAYAGSFRAAGGIVLLAVFAGSAALLVISDDAPDPTATAAGVAVSALVALGLFWVQLRARRAQPALDKDLHDALGARWRSQASTPSTSPTRPAMTLTRTPSGPIAQPASSMKAISSGGASGVWRTSSGRP